MLSARMISGLSLLAILIAVAWIFPTGAQDFASVQIGTHKVTENVYMLTGSGGNIGVSTGDDGIFLVDDQYAPLTEKILAAVRSISARPVRFVLNTHWHGDHTGGNENLAKAAVLIVAHENVRKRMSVEQFIEAFGSRTPPAPRIALPVVTFSESVTFHFNNEEIHAFHVSPAHTDGDSIIHFRKGNVIHMGDLFFNGIYPFIDAGTGGSLDGMIAAADRILSLADDRTKIIPGHGPLADRAQLRSYRDMLAAVRDRVLPLVKEGKTVQEIQAAKPTRDFDEKWGKGFLNPDRFVEVLHGVIRKGLQ